MARKKTTKFEDESWSDNFADLSSLQMHDAVRSELSSKVAPFWYTEELCILERKYKNSANALFVWQAINLFREYRKKYTYTCLPTWCLDYLAESAGRLEALYALEPSDAVDQIPSALKLSLGRGKNCFLEMKRHAEAELVLSRYNRHRRDGRTAAQAKRALTVEQGIEHRKPSKDASDNGEDDHLSERTIERKIKEALKIKKV